MLGGGSQGGGSGQPSRPATLGSRAPGGRARPTPRLHLRLLRLLEASSAGLNGRVSWVWCFTGLLGPEAAPGFPGEEQALGQVPRGAGRTLPAPHPAPRE